MTTINSEPVTKKELWGILTDFFEQVIAPYLDLRFDKLDDRLDRHGRQLDNHEVRVTKLETPLA